MSVYLNERRVINVYLERNIQTNCLIAYELLRFNSNGYKDSVKKEVIQLEKYETAYTYCDF